MSAEIEPYRCLQLRQQRVRRGGRAQVGVVRRASEGRQHALDLRDVLARDSATTERLPRRLPKSWLVSANTRA
jgi:hypothetical protein